MKAGSKLMKDCAYLSSNEAITEPLYIKSTSVLFSRDPQELPEWVVYQVKNAKQEGKRQNGCAGDACCGRDASKFSSPPDLRSSESHQKTDLE